MIRRLGPEDEQLVKDFAYERERENLFVIGSFRNYGDTLNDNWFFGYFEGDEMVGMATLFKRWGSFVVNAQDDEVIRALVDEVVKVPREILHVPCFKRYAEVIIERLEELGLSPKKKAMHTVFILEEDYFEDFSEGDEEIAGVGDLDELILFDREIAGKSLEEPITDFERERTNVHEMFILRRDGRIVSKANPHGYSKNFFQVGGVGTLKEYRGQGLAKQVVSKLCRHFFDDGVSTGLLFTDRENVSAIKVYESLGFKADTEFIVADY